MRTCLIDLRYALRVIGRRPGRSGLCVLILALGIGSATAVFSVVDQTVLRAAPFAYGERLVDVSDFRRGGGGGSGHNAEKVLGWRAQTSVFERLETYAPRMSTLVGDGEPERISALGVSPGLFEMLGVQPVGGRAFMVDDAEAGPARVAIVGEPLATRRLGGVEHALGRTLSVDGRLVTVVGVMPAAFMLTGRDQVWLPLDPQQQLGQPRRRDLFVLARLAAGVTVEEAQRRADAIADRLQAETPMANTWDIRIDEKRVTSVTAATASGLLVLLGGVGCLWLLASLAAMQVMLATAADQSHELRVRASLGASRRRLVSQVLLQTGLLALGAGAAGAAAAFWAVRLFAVSLPSSLMFLRTTPMAVDLRVLLLTSTASLIAALLAGLVPGLWATRSRSFETRDRVGAAPSSSGADAASAILATAQITGAVVLAVGAALMLRTVASVARIPLGFDPTSIVSMSVNLPIDRYPTAASQYAFTSRVLERLKGAPGISSASVAGGLTFTSYGYEPMASADGTVLPDNELLAVNSVGAGYFETLGVRVLAGRTFTRDDAGTPAVIVGRTLAHRLWATGDAVGARFRTIADGRDFTVVGVVDDLDVRPAHDRPIRLQWYQPRTPQPAPAGRPSGSTSQRFILRAVGVEAAVAGMKAAAWADDPALPIERVMRAEDELRDVFASHVLIERLATFLAVLGVAVASISVFGVLAHLVAARRREIGVRMALGATASRISRLVLGRATWMILSGLALGLVAASGLTSTLESMLFGVSPLDALSLWSAVLGVGAIGTLAAWWPARIAARIDPATAIRED